MAKISKDEKYRLKCEALMNEAYGTIGKYGEDLTRILEKGGPENEEERSILIIAGEVISMQLDMSQAEDDEIRGAEVYNPSKV